MSWLEVSCAVIFCAVVFCAAATHEGISPEHTAVSLFSSRPSAMIAIAELPISDIAQPLTWRGFFQINGAATIAGAIATRFSIISVQIPIGCFNCYFWDHDL